jgi:hypothetical protein
MTCWPLWAWHVKNVVRCKQTCHYTLAILHDLNFFTTIPSAINEIELIYFRGPVANRRGVEHPDNSTKRFKHKINFCTVYIDK